MKITETHKRDFNAYLRWYRLVGPKFYPFISETVVRGITPTIKGFVLFESQGKIVAVRHPRVLTAVFKGKQLLNFQIKQWAEGVAGGETLVSELKDAFLWLPEWVFISVLHKAKKLIHTAWKKEMLATKDKKYLQELKLC